MPCFEAGEYMRNFCNCGCIGGSALESNHGVIFYLVLNTFGWPLNPFLEGGRSFCVGLDIINKMS